MRNTYIPTASSYSAIMRSRSDVSRVAKPSRSDVEHSPLLSRSGSQTLRNELTAMEDGRPTMTEQTAEPTTGAVPVVSARDRDSTSQTSEGAQRDHYHFVAAE